ncbi:penicillin acylase family protein [Cellulomonas soli]
MTARTEVIKVAGADDVEITVRATVHGPIVSDVLDIDEVRTAPVPEDSPRGRYEVALAWTALTPGTTADAIFAFDLAGDAQDVAAAAALFDVPSQNIVFATTDGHIGYQAPGAIPVRAAVAGAAVPSDGTWPRPGWDSAYDWQGYVDDAAMPRALDPEDGLIVAANQAVTPEGTGPYLTVDWDYGYRSQRIRDVLTDQVERGVAIDAESTSALQVDQHSPYADVLVPALVDLPLPDLFSDDGQELLRQWDGVADENSAAAAYLAAVWKTLLQLTFADDLPDGHGASGDSRWLEVVRRLLEQPDSPWWDDRSTPGLVEGRDEILTQALVQARLELTARAGSRRGGLAVGAAARGRARAPRAGWLVGAGDRARPGEPGRTRGRRRVVGRRRDGVGRLGRDVHGHGCAVDAHGGRPGRPGLLDVGDADGHLRAPGQPALRRPVRGLGRGETFAWPFSRAATDADASDILTLTP